MYFRIIEFFEHTIDSKFIRKQSLTLRPRWFPPKSTAWWLLTAVKEKEEQGGGLVPLVGGEDHVPAKSKVVWYHVHTAYRPTTK